MRTFGANKGSLVGVSDHGPDDDCHHGNVLPRHVDQKDEQKRQEDVSGRESQSRKKVHLQSYDLPGPRSSAKLYNTNISLLKNNKKNSQSFRFHQKRSEKFKFHHT